MSKKGPLCLDPNDTTKEGLFNPELVQCNADSITLISSGRPLMSSFAIKMPLLNVGG